MFVFGLLRSVRWCAAPRGRVGTKMPSRSAGRRDRFKRDSRRVPLRVRACGAQARGQFEGNPSAHDAHLCHCGFK